MKNSLFQSLKQWKSVPVLSLYLSTPEREMSQDRQTWTYIYLLYIYNNSGLFVFLNGYLFLFCFFKINQNELKLSRTFVCLDAEYCNYLFHIASDKLWNNTCLSCNILIFLNVIIFHLLYWKANQHIQK